MGLLNFLPEDETKKQAARQGLLSLGAAMLQGRGNFGNVLGQGIAAGAQGYQGSLQDQQRAQLHNAQAERWKADAEKDRNAIAKPGRIASVLSRVNGGGAPAESGGVAPISALPMKGGTTAPIAAPVIPVQNDYRAYIARGDALANEGFMDEAKEMYAAADKMKPKLKELKELTKGGKRVMANVYDDGRTEELEGFAPAAEKLAFQNTGGATVALDPFTGKPVQTIRNTQTPDSVASGQIQMRGQNMIDARSQEANRISQANQALGRVPAGYRANPDGSLSPIPGGPADKNANGNMTEDQGKATGWLVQAQNAHKNMMAVGLDKNGNPTSAAKPGINDGLAQIPSFGLTTAMANTFRGADRQKFMQASSSLSESLLRAATGAGVNKDEAAQKVQELTPQFGEADEVTKQKFAAIPLYIESLKVRAGPGASKAARIGSPAAPFSDADKERRYQEWKASQGKK